MSARTFGVGEALYADDIADMTFPNPWAAQLFAVTLAASEAGVFTLAEFQTAMIAEVGRFERDGFIADETTYYERWIAALSALLAEKRLLDDNRLSVAEARLRSALADLHAHQPHGTEPAPIVVDRS